MDSFVFNFIYFLSFGCSHCVYVSIDFALLLNNLLIKMPLFL